MYRRTQPARALNATKARNQRFNLEGITQRFDLKGKMILT